MGSYEYHEFRAVDRPLTAAEQAQVARLSSRAEVSARHAAFVYHYSSFRGDPDELLDTLFDAMFFISSYGAMQLVFSLPREHFDPARAEPYLVDESQFAYSGVQAHEQGNRVLLSVGLEELELGWVDGDGWLESLLPLRDELLAGDDRPLSLFWLATFENGLVDPEEPGAPPIPPGMGDLTEAQSAFAPSFGVSAGLLATVAQESPPRSETSDRDLDRAVAALDDRACKELLLRVGRGEHVEVYRELGALARAETADAAVFSSRSLDELDAAAMAEDERLARCAEEARLDELEANREPLWREIESLVSRAHPRYDKPVRLLAALHEVSTARGGRGAFIERLTRLERYGKSQAFMQRLRNAGLPG